MLAVAPNNGKKFVTSTSAFPPTRALTGVDEYFQVPVGPPEASLAVSVIEPTTEQTEPRATLLVLHGLGASSFWMLDAAHEFAAEGYRVVLVDLRGHGGSTGNWLTFGPRESRDIVKVLDELEQRRLLEGPLGVYGISFGAVTAIHLSAIDRRVSAVVAIAPFADIREEAPHYFKLFFPGLGHAISDDSYQEAVDLAGEYAAYDPDEANTKGVLPYAQSPVLLIHGRNDWIVPPKNSEDLQATSPWNSQLKLIDGAGHFSIWYDQNREVEKAAKSWFEQHLTVSNGRSDETQIE